jgi:hypothetical protein
MLQTALCIAVVLVSVAALGAPLRWLLNRRQPLSATDWVEAPFLGVAALVLVLQNLVYLDLPVQTTCGWIWLATLLLWGWMAWRRQVLASLAAVPRWLVVAAVGVYLVHGAGLLWAGAAHYMGRAWTDQYTYTVQAEFLVHERFSTTWADIDNRPYLEAALGLKADRLGQSLLLGFFAVSSAQETKVLYEATSLLSPALVVLALYVLSRRYGLSARQALATGVAAGLLPGLAMVHLECFLSHALAIPLILFCLVAVYDLGARPEWRGLLKAALLIAGATSIWKEGWLILVGVTVLTLGGAAVVRCLSWPRMVALSVVLPLAPFVFNPGYTSWVKCITARVSEPILSHVFPWAYEVDGLSCIWWGDIVGAPDQTRSTWSMNTTPGASPWLGDALGDSLRKKAWLVRGLTLALTALGAYGLVRSCLRHVFDAQRAAWTNPEHRRSCALALSVLGLAAFPLLLDVKDSQHSYQYYRSLLMVCPLFALGVSLVGYSPPWEAARAGAAAGRGENFQVRRLTTGLLLTCVVVLGVLGTSVMAVQPAQPQWRWWRSGAAQLLERDVQQLEHQLTALHDCNLLIESDSSPHLLNRPLLSNCWVYYFARHNRVRRGSAQPGAAPTQEPTGSPGRCYVLKSRRGPSSGFAQLSAGDATLAWSNASFELWQMDSERWAFLERIDSPNGVEGEQRSFLWLGNDPAKLEVTAGGHGYLTLRAQFSLGPSLPDVPLRRVKIATNHGHEEVVEIHGGGQAVTLPVPAGKTTISLVGLDRPTLAQLPGGDRRALLVGVQGLSIGFSAQPMSLPPVKTP